MKASTLKHTALALALALAQAQGAWAGTEVLAISGQSAPGTGAGGTFSSFALPLLTHAGQAAFLAEVSGSKSSIGLFRKSADGKPTPFAVQGQSATGAGAGTFSDFLSLDLNNAGEAAFVADITGGTSIQGLYRGSSDGTLSAIALQDQLAAGAGAGRFSRLSNARLNDAGQAAFEATITGGTSAGGLYRSDPGGTPTVIALRGQNAAGTGAGTFSSFSAFALNDTGVTAFRGFIAGGSSAQGIYRSSGNSTPTATALLGQSAPESGAGTFSRLSNPALNNAGQTAFLASIDGGTIRQGIYRSNSDNSLTAIALLGQSATDAGAVTFSRFVDSHQIVQNEAGQIAFMATTSDDAYGLYRSNPDGTITAIARLGRASEGIFIDGGLVLSDSGQVAYLARNVGRTGSKDLYIGDGRDTVAVQLQGATLADKTVSSLTMSPRGLNRHGQVAYRASFTDSTQGVFLFTPELHWRNTASGSWEDAANWTLGVNPADVHDVVLDPTNSLRISGPTGAVTLKSMQVGTGAGLVTLQMAGGSIDAADPIVIGTQGLLTGTGSFSRLVINEGTVQADRLVMSAKLSNAALLRGVAGGPRFNAGLQADLLNQATGRVLVQPGETLQLRGASHRNLGVFEINQGRLEVAGTLLNGSGGVIDLNRSTTLAEGAWTNTAGARILLSDARLTVSKGLTNAGQVLVTSGDSDVFGDLSNEKGGQIILSGQGSTTFYDAVELQASSELRTSAGATAVFFGAVAQRSGALLSGTGHKYFEGGFSVGNSPGLGEDSGDVSFGTSNVYLAELGGTELGSSYDHYRVAGTLTLGGTLRLASFAGFSGQAGQSFDLFDWGSLQGQFSHIDSSGLLLAEGTQLDLSRLYIDGVIGVTAVPEPQQWALLLSGGLGLLAWRRRPARQL